MLAVLIGWAVIACASGASVAANEPTVAVTPRPDSCPPVGDQVDSLGLPYYRGDRVDVRVRPAVRSLLGPDHPHVVGSTVVTFVVDFTGRTDMRTVRFVRSDDERITAAVRKFLQDARWEPAILRGCPVRSLVQQTFSFERR